MKRVRLPVCSVVGLAFLLAGFASYARMSPRQIYKQKAPGVVLIVASPEGSSSASAGTGSIIRSDGTVVTNAHVIYSEADKAPYKVIHVFLKPAKVTGNMNKDLKRHFSASVVAYDRGLDLAILKMKNPPAGLTVQTLGDPNELGPGDETIAIGHPEQGGLWTITTGVIGTEFEDFKGVPGKHVFQMETSLNRGNSGGPLFDIRGYQVGVNTAIARKGEGGVAITGVNFAVKASVVKQWASRHSVMLSYGTESLTQQDTRVAVAEAALPPTQPAVESTPAPAPTPPPVEQPRDTGKVYRDPESGGTIRVEDDPEPEATQPATATESTEARRRFKKKPKRKPIRFKKHYRIRPRPYSYRRLFTAVDRVRDRADKAFDDLDREIMRRRR